MSTFDNSPGSNFLFFLLLPTQSQEPRPTVFARRNKEESGGGETIVRTNQKRKPKAAVVIIAHAYLISGLCWKIIIIELLKSTCSKPQVRTLQETSLPSLADVVELMKTRLTFGYS
jgi:hypothetical protein